MLMIIKFMPTLNTSKQRNVNAITTDEMKQGCLSLTELTARQADKLEDAPEFGGGNRNGFIFRSIAPSNGRDCSSDQ